MNSKHKRVSVIIPALNEQDSIGLVIRDIPRHLADEIIVVNNGSTDRTAEVAHAAGARVVNENHRGYGAACLKGIASAMHPDIIVFMDGDYSDYPEEMEQIIAPLLTGAADLVIGSRKSVEGGKKSIPLHAYWGNRLITRLIRLFYRHHFSDVGPFRAICFQSLQKLGMTDRDYGWTVEMQIKAVIRGLTIVEIPVRYRKRIGKSKVSGTIAGSARAGLKMLVLVLTTAVCGYVRSRHNIHLNV